MAEASYIGKVGQSGGVTGPHLHLGLTVDGKRIPLSQAGRSFAGRRIQYRLPGSQEWQSLYTPSLNPRDPNGRPSLNPGVKITDPFGVRAVHPVTGEKNVPHTGEDYNLPFGTQLRVLGPGTTTPLANVGNAGNLTRFSSKTPDNRQFTLEFMHLSELPGGQTKTGGQLFDSTPPPAPVLPPSEEEVKQGMVKEMMKKLLFEAALNKSSGAQLQTSSPYDQIPDLASLVQFG